MKHLLQVALVLIMQASPFPAFAQYKIYEKGFEAYKAGNFANAISNFTEFLSKPARDNSLDAEIYYLRGLSHYKVNDFKNAKVDFLEAINLNHPNKGNINWFLAKTQEQLGFYFDATNSYDNAIKELFSNKEVLVTLLLERSQIYLKLKERALAYNDLQRAYDIHPGHASINSELEKFTDMEIASYQNARAIRKNETTLQSDSVNTSKLAEFYKNEKRYALVIGNSKYLKPIGELKNPVNDAIDMAAELEASNFEVDLLTNATYGQIRASLLKFKDKIDAGERDNTVALFYFAGHGLRQDEENYIVPVDAVIEFEDDIRRYCFPVQRMVLGNMENSNSRMNIVILDACRNNPFPSLTRSLGQQGLGEMKKARGSFIAYATAPGSVAIDGTGRNGIYTQEILKAIRKPGLTIEQVFKEVRLNVLRISNQKQNTWDNSNITGEFYFKF